MEQRDRRLGVGHATPRAARISNISAVSHVSSISPSSSLHHQERHRAALRPPRPLKVVLIGPGSVGKTSLRQAYFTNRFQHNYKATIGADFEAKVVEYRYAEGFARTPHDDEDDDEDDGQDEEAPRKATLTIWDTAGQERFRALGSAFYRGADAALVCFDASSEDAEAVKIGLEEWYTEFAKHAGLESQEDKKRFCWIAVGCKSDLRLEKEDAGAAGAASGAGVPRRKVREWLDALIPRGPTPPASAKMPQPSVPGHGDRPPADPLEVLAREGRHRVDDRELGIETSEENGEIAQVSESAEQHGEGESVAAMATADADTSDDDEEGGKQVGDKTVNGRSSEENALRPFPSSSPPRTPPSGRNGSSAAPRAVTRSEAPSTSATANGNEARTPPAKATMQNGALTVDAGMPRHRLDSTRSLASTTTQMSVYHTPRNSTFWHGSSSTVASSSKLDAGSRSPDVGAMNGSPAGGMHGMGRRDSTGSSSDGSAASTTRMGGEDEARLTAKERAARRRALTPSSTSTVVKHTHANGRHEEDEDGLATSHAASNSAQDPFLCAVKQSKGEPSAPPSNRTPLARPPPRIRALSTPSVQSLAPPTVIAPTQINGKATTAGSSRRPSPQARPPPPPPMEGFSLFYTSSLTGTNVKEVFEHVVSRVARRWQYEEWREGEAEMAEGAAGNGKGTTRRQKGGAGKLNKRRSWWLGGGGGGGGPAGRGAGGEEDGVALETRRMVRLSDGKGDDSARLFGGCC